jgi:hypothetical protein
MMIAIRLGDAKAMWGDRLTISALGTFRIIYDDSYRVLFNHRIRARDKLR